MKLAVNRNKTVPALLSAFACAAIWAHLDMSSYEPLLLGAFAALYFLFSAAAVCSGRKIMLPATVLGFIFALFTLLGNLDVLAEQKTYVLWCMIRLFGFWSMYWAMLALIFRKLSSVSLMCDAASERSVRNCRRVFLGSFAALTAVYAIWWLYEFPGNTSPDSNSQIMQVTGLMPLRSNHPAVSTMFLGVIFNAGLKLFAGNQNSALALYTAIQLLIMAAIFAYAAESVYEMGLKKGAVYFVLAVYLLHPVYASYSVTVWKDVLFSGWITGFCVTLWRMLQKGKSAIRPWEIVLLFFFALAASLFRNKCYYAFLLLFPFIFVQFNKRNRWVQAMPAVVFALALLIDGPLFSALNIRHMDSVESLSIPSQHIARVIADGHDLSEEQKELLSHAVDIDAVAETYNANVSDPIKKLIRSTGDVGYIDAHRSEYFKLWLELGMRYPGAYLRAQIDQTKGYWYPDCHYWSMSNHCQPSDVLTIHKDRQTPAWLTSVLDSVGFGLPLLPFGGLLFSIGLAWWATLVLFALCGIRGRKDVMTVFLPVLALILTLCAVTPVYAEFRYSFAMYTTLPLFAVIPFARPITANR